MAEKSLKAFKQRYEFDRWFNVNRLDEALFVRHYFVADELVRGFELIRASSAGAPGQPPAMTSLWRDAGGDTDQLLRIDFSESDSRAAAHGALLQVLGQFESPNIKRQVTSEIGDVAFGADDTAVVVSARANLVIFLASVGRTPVDVQEVAAQLDRALTERPAQPEAMIAAAAPRRFSARFEHGIESVVSGARATIQVAVDEELEEPPMLRFFSRGGEVFAEGEHVIFESDESEDNDVTVYALERQGPPQARSYACRVD